MQYDVSLLQPWFYDELGKDRKDLSISRPVFLACGSSPEGLYIKPATQTSLPNKVRKKSVSA